MNRVAATNIRAHGNRELDGIAVGMACPARAEVRRLIEHTWVSDATIDTAVRIRADLIVMATRGENELRHEPMTEAALQSHRPLVLSIAAVKS